MTRQLSVPGRQPMRILEVGAGTGAITAVIAEQLISGDFLDVVEMDHELAAIIRNQMDENSAMAVHREQIQVTEVDIRDFRPAAQYDLVISALPFNNFEPELTKAIFERLFSMTADTGQLVFFEYYGIRALKKYLSFGKFRKKEFDLPGYLCGLHQKSSLRAEFIFRNLPPAVAYMITFSRNQI